ncbi:PQQ-binding-like beta-propeller repeat protein [Comamonas aquatica]|uniref:PQQ-binding-like beta-propeller repeat protein n=1 Tax=Comamonas aquatica TaxID=225991 RepID=UPI001B390B80|nr:PQQ-binding-like beta-propeller repeat protein [Comamonas aquatica]QTX22145.1 PQQ-binding-like beta-propeller repeat protein [Comamonas aquatica]
MTHKLAARVGAQGAVVGTAAVTFGAALAAHKAFGAVLATGDTTEYLLYACDASGAATGAWEVGVGTYYGPDDAGGERLERTTVHENSAGTAAAIDFAAGDKRVVITPLASRLAMIPPGGAEGQMLALDAATGKLKWVDAPTGGGGGTSLLPLPDYRLFLFVRDDGNDANSGLENTAGGALKTLEAALAKVYTYDIPEGDTVTITFGSGTYSCYDFPQPASHPLEFTISLEPDDAATVVFDVLQLGITKQLIEADNVRLCKANLKNAALYDITLGDAVDGVSDATLTAGRDGNVTVMGCTAVGDCRQRFMTEQGAKLEVYTLSFAAGSHHGTAVCELGPFSEIALVDFTGTTTGKKFNMASFSILRSPGEGGMAALPGDSDGYLPTAGYVI